MRNECIQETAALTVLLQGHGRKDRLIALAGNKPPTTLRLLKETIMSHLNTDVIRAWKNPQYRNSVSEQDVASLPAHPEGIIELSEALTATVTGGFINPAINRAVCGSNTCYKG